MKFSILKYWSRFTTAIIWPCLQISRADWLVVVTTVRFCVRGLLNPRIRSTTNIHACVGIRIHYLISSSPNTNLKEGKKNLLIAEKMWIEKRKSDFILYYFKLKNIKVNYSGYYSLSNVRYLMKLQILQKFRASIFEIASNVGKKFSVNSDP